MRFDLDEPLFPTDDALPGLLTGRQMDALHQEWKAAKVDEWCAVAALTGTATALRSAVGAPVDARIVAVLAVAGWDDNTHRSRVQRALAAYTDAATFYEGVRVQLADIRRRAFIVPAA